MNYPNTIGNQDEVSLTGLEKEYSFLKRKYENLMKTLGITREELLGNNSLIEHLDQPSDEGKKSLMEELEATVTKIEKLEENVKIHINNNLEMKIAAMLDSLNIDRSSVSSAIAKQKSKIEGLITDNLKIIVEKESLKLKDLEQLKKLIDESKDFSEFLKKIVEDESIVIIVDDEELQQLREEIEVFNKEIDCFSEGNGMLLLERATSIIIKIELKLNQDLIPDIKEEMRGTLSELILKKNELEKKIIAPNTEGLKKEIVVLMSELGVENEEQVKALKNYLEKELKETRESEQETRVQFMNNIKKCDKCLSLIKSAEEIESVNSDDTIKAYEELHSQIINTPKCSERSLLEIILILNFMSLDEYKKKEIKSQFNGNQDIIIKINDISKLEEEVKTLKEQMNREELLTNQSMSNLIGNIEYNQKHGNKENLLINLKQLLKEIRVLDIPFLKSLLSENQDAEKIIKGKKVVALFGITGSGKSTTIHYLGHSRMELVTQNNLQHIGPVEIKNEWLIKVTTSPEKRSETRHIIPVKIKTANEEIFLCDLPGYGETRGPEVDIANAYGILNNLSKANSIRPVFLFSSRSIGDRLEGLEKAADYIVNMFKTEDYKEMFKNITYLFTNFKESEHKDIHEQIKNKFQNTEKKSSSFTMFFNDLQKKTRHGAMIVNPLNPSRIEEIWEEIMSGEEITYPEEHLRFSLYQETRDYISSYLHKTKNVIRIACKLLNFPLVKYKMEEIKVLYEVTDIEEVKQVNNDCVNLISETLLTNYKDGVDKINRALLFTNELLEDDLKEHKKRLEISKSAEEVRIKYLENKVPGYESLSSNIISEVTKMIESLPAENKFKNPDLKIVLDKINLIVKHFNESEYNFGNQIEILKEEISSHLKKLFENFTNFTSECNFKKCEEILEEYNIIFKLTKSHLDSSEIQENYEEMKKIFIDNLESLKKGVSVLLSSKEKLNENDIINLNEKETLFENLQNFSSLNNHFEVKELNNYLKDFFSFIEDYFDNFNNKVKEKLISLSTREKEMYSTFTILETQDSQAITEVNNLKEIEPLFNQLKLIRTIKNIESRTSEKFYSTSQILFDYVNMIKINAENLTSQIISSEDTRDLGKLQFLLKNILEAKWLDEVKKDTTEDFVERIVNKIKKVIEDFKANMVYFNLSLKDFKNLQVYTQKVSTISGLKQIGAIGPKIKFVDELKEIENQYENSIQNIYSEIDDLCKEETLQFLDYQKYERAIEFCSTAADLRSYNQSHSNISNNFVPLIISKKNVYEKSLQLENFLNKYSGGLVKNLELKSVSIQDRQNSDFNLIQGTALILEEMNEIKNYTNCYKIIDEKNYYSVVIKQLEEFYLTFEHELDEISHNKNKLIQFKAALEYANSMRHLDEHIKYKFRDLYVKYRNRLMDVNLPENVENLRKLIEEEKFNEISRKMTLIKSLKEIDSANGEYFEILQKQLEDKIIEISDKTRLLSNTSYQLNTKTVEEIIKNLKNLTFVQNKLTELIDEHISQLINEGIQRTQKMLNMNIKKMIENIKAKIKNNNFTEAEDIRTKTWEIISLLDNYCDKGNLEAIEDIEKLQSKKLKELEDKYKTLPFNMYYFNSPKEILQKLSKNSDYFHENIERIKGSILNKFKEEISRINKIGRADQKDNEFKQMKKYSSKTFLPEDLCVYVECLIDFPLNEVHKFQNKSDPNKPIFEEDSVILDQAKIHKNNIEKELKNENFEEALNDIIKFYYLFNNDVNLDNHDNLNKTIDEVKQKLNNFISKILENIFNYYLCPNKNFNLLSCNKIVDKSENRSNSDLFLLILNFKNNNKRISDYFLPDLNLKILKSIDTIVNQCYNFLRNPKMDEDGLVNFAEFYNELLNFNNKLLNFEFKSNTSDIMQLINNIKEITEEVRQSKYFPLIENIFLNNKIKYDAWEILLNNLCGLVYTDNKNNIINIDEIILKKMYANIKEKYYSVIEANLKHPIDYKKIMSEISNLVEGIAQIKDKLIYSKEIKDKIIPQLISYVFAVWSLQNLNDKKSSNKNFNLNYSDKMLYLSLKQPHPEQILSIIRIFNLDNNEEKLINNSVQIEPEKGKCFIIAITASLLALIGFDVSCAHLNSTLSKENYENFESLFELLNVSNSIYYGELNKICEKVFNKNLRLREEVTSIILRGKGMSKKSNTRANILMINEIDVLFDKSFYAGEYTSFTMLNNKLLPLPLIKEFLEHFWSKRKENLEYGDIINSKVFSNLVKYFGFKNLFEEIVKEVISDVKSFDMPPYIVEDDKIGYKDEKGKIAFDDTYNFKTIFAYINEFEKKKISEQSLNDNLFIPLKCGYFSYAEILSQQFDCIIGISENLKNLSYFKKEILKNDFNLQFHFRVPFAGLLNQNFILNVREEDKCFREQYEKEKLFNEELISRKKEAQRFLNSLKNLQFQEIEDYLLKIKKH